MTFHFQITDAAVGFR